MYVLEVKESIYEQQYWIIFSEISQIQYGC